MANFRSNKLDVVLKEMKETIENDVSNIAKVSDFNVLYGVPEGFNDDGDNIADYAVLVHDGSFTQNIPARPFLRTVKDRYGQRIANSIKRALIELKNKSVGGYVLKEDEVRAILEKNIALAMQNFTKDNVLNGNWVANSPGTIAKKGSSKPLIDEGFLINSIIGIVVND